MTSSSSAPPPISPGAYIRKRREAAGFGLRQAAATIAALPWAVRPAGPQEVNLMSLRLQSAEADSLPFGPEQLGLIRNVFPLDPQVYLELLAIHRARLAGDGSDAGLVAPQLCRGCACSWCDPCITDAGPCAWAAKDLCTACVRAEAAQTELGGASRMFVLHAQPAPVLA